MRKAIKCCKKTGPIYSCGLRSKYNFDDLRLSLQDINNQLFYCCFTLLYYSHINALHTFIAHLFEWEYVKRCLKLKFSNQIYHEYTYTIQFVVRQHDEELVGNTAGRTLWDQHVLRPTASAEVERCQVAPARVVSLDRQVTESLFERNSHGRLGGLSSNFVFAGIHCNVT